MLSEVILEMGVVRGRKYILCSILIPPEEISGQMLMLLFVECFSALCLHHYQRMGYRSYEEASDSMGQEGEEEELVHHRIGDFFSS